MREILPDQTVTERVVPWHSIEERRELPQQGSERSPARIMTVSQRLIISLIN